MKKDWILTQEAFDNLLAWLDPDRERAGQTYQDIRRNLVRIFARRGCAAADELADETMNRVARKALEVAPTYVGDPALYFYKVGKFVYKEYLTQLNRLNWLPVPQPDPPEDKEPYLDRLDRCMEQLDPESKDLILEYYFEEKKARIDHRSEMAERCGITLNALRTRVHRIKISLQECVDDRLTQNKTS